jgi:hypothetical protein
MKTAREAFDRAFALLGYTDRIGNLDADKFAPQYRQSMAYCQTVLDDICRIEGNGLHEIEDIDEELPISSTSINLVMPYGLAMYLAEIDGDGTKQQMFALQYEQRLGYVPKPQKSVTLNYSPIE